MKSFLTEVQNIIKRQIHACTLRGTLKQNIDKPLGLSACPVSSLLDTMTNAYRCVRMCQCTCIYEQTRKPDAKVQKFWYLYGCNPNITNCVHIDHHRVRFIVSVGGRPFVSRASSSCHNAGRLILKYLRNEYLLSKSRSYSRQQHFT